LVPLWERGPHAVLIWSGALLLNLICTHIRGALKTRIYSPGIVTGLALYVPLFVASYGYFLSQHVVSGWEALGCLLVSTIPEIYFSLKKVPQREVTTDIAAQA